MTQVKFEIQYIPVKNLSVVWVQSQRNYNDRWAKEIAENFDPDKFDPIVVTKPNGQGMYHIIEGQHRRHALEMFAAKMNKSGDGSTEQAPCRVVADADPARAAEIWLGINGGRKSVSAVSQFKVAVVANREPEKSIHKIVVKHGYQVATGRADNYITAVAALSRVYNRHSPETLEHVLEATRFLWGKDPQAVCSSLILGFGIFLHEFSTHVNAPRLRKQIGDRFTPWKFLEAAKVRRDSTQERLDEAVAELLVREYNKGLKENFKLRRKS